VGDSDIEAAGDRGDGNDRGLASVAAFCALANETATRALFRSPAWGEGGVRADRRDAFVVQQQVKR
jgi:hypothetical protein